MKDTSAIEFKVLRSSWGVYIRLKASVVPMDLNEKDKNEHLFDKLFLTFSINVDLSDDEREMFVEGLKSSKDLVHTDGFKLLTIEEVFFVDSDFQIEGLYWAAKKLIVDLMEEEFEMPLVDFDKKGNRYIFNYKK